jgi:hypothetical protein
LSDLRRDLRIFVRIQTGQSTEFYGLFMAEHDEPTERLHRNCREGLRQEAFVRQRTAVSILAASLAIAAECTGHAGLFSKKCDDSCCPETPKKSCLSALMPPPAPRAGTAIAVPAVVTNQRADRLPPKAEVPPPPVCPDLTKRVDDLDRDVKIIKEQLRVLTEILQASK